MKELRQIKRIGKYSISIIETDNKGIRLFLTNWDNKCFEITFDLSNGIKQVKASLPRLNHTLMKSLKSVKYIEDNAYSLYLILEREITYSKLFQEGISEARKKFYRNLIKRLNKMLAELNSYKIKKGKKRIDNK